MTQGVLGLAGCIRACSPACAGGPAAAAAASGYYPGRPRARGGRARHDGGHADDRAGTARRAAPNDISREENWTLNGPLLDGLTFIGGLEHGKRDRPAAPQGRPPGAAISAPTCSPPEIAAMIETFYRIRAGSVQLRDDRPQAAHLPRPSRLPVRLRSSRRQRGRAAGQGGRRDHRATVSIWSCSKARKMHYFAAALPEFERIVESATLNASS